MARPLSGFRNFRDTAAEAGPVRPRSSRQAAPASSPGGHRVKSLEDPPAAANATVTSQRVRTRFVMVHTEAGERPGLILEWVKAAGTWSARVAYIVDDNATMIVEWLGVSVLTPIPQG